MTLGRTPRQGDIFRGTVGCCEGRVAPDSIYALLHRECCTLFDDEMFADLFTDVGRRSIPPTVVAVVMVLQRIEGLSDREAVERFSFDARWKYAAGGLDFDYPGFAHTVLVDMRARLARSERPNRIFEVTLDAARSAGLVGRRRVLDCTPLYDAVATMDTVTLIRSAIRGLLAAAGEEQARLRGLLRRDDDYVGAGKPVCDYDDPTARAELVAALATDANALLAALDGQQLPAPLAMAAALAAAVVGQDLDQGLDGVFRIARRVAKNRIISTVDPQARHGHKTSARGFDGDKGHVAVDPDSELVTATAVSAANSGDAATAADLLADDLPAGPASTDEPTAGGSPAAPAAAGQTTVAPPAGDDTPEEAGTPEGQTVTPSTGTPPTVPASCSTSSSGPAWTSGARCSRRQPPPVGSPRTPSPWIWPPGPSRVPPVGLRRCAPPHPAPWPTSARPARAARWPPSAPPPRAGAPSTSAPMSSGWPTPGPVRSTRVGRPTTRPPDPRSSARSAI
jgi:hypothetical protein